MPIPIWDPVSEIEKFGSGINIPDGATQHNTTPSSEGISKQAN